VDLKLRFGLISSVEGIEFLISILGPDDEASEMTTGGKEKDVQAVNAKNVNAGKVAERSEEGSLLFVDNQRSLSLNISPVTGFSFTSSDLLGILNFLNISISFQGLEKFHGLRGFLKGRDRVGANNERNFGDFLNSMTAGKN